VPIFLNKALKGTQRSVLKKMVKLTFCILADDIFIKYVKYVVVYKKRVYI